MYIFATMRTVNCRGYNLHIHFGKLYLRQEPDIRKQKERENNTSSVENRKRGIQLYIKKINFFYMRFYLIIDYLRYQTTN